MRSHRWLHNVFIAVVLIAWLPGESLPQARRLLADLRGRWLFEIGDNLAWVDPAFNDRTWDSVMVPSPWEDQGYPGYDGYAWYRKHFTVKRDWKERTLSLIIGTIDDVDEVYVNGHYIGFSGQFPPAYMTAYASGREYPLPSYVLNERGDNVIAVRVYDRELSGGITGGEVGIAEELDPLHPDVTLAGMWKIMQGDDFAWKEPGYNDAAWDQIRVPAYWETQGMKGYDGFAWYRLHFRPEPGLAGKTLVLLLGKIDDLDEAFLNGESIGRTGTLSQFRGNKAPVNEYKELRAYSVPAGLLHVGEDNVIAVRVLDTFLHGGIYDGPVGLISRDAYAAWAKRHRRAPGNLWEAILEWLR